MEYVSVSVEGQCETCYIPLQLHAVWVPEPKVDVFSIALEARGLWECLECSEISESLKI